MSADCTYVLRHVSNVDNLKRTIMLKLNSMGYGVWVCPKNALLLFNSISLANSDFCFSPTDAPDTVNVDLLISHENHYVNDKCAEQSLQDRLLFLQELARECIQHANSVEIYISEDDPYLPDYSSYVIPWKSVAETLLREYQQNIFSAPMIPSVRLLVIKE